MQGEITAEKQKEKKQDKENMKDTFYLLVAVMGTLFVISAIMVYPPFSSFPLPSSVSTQLFGYGNRNWQWIYN